MQPTPPPPRRFVLIVATSKAVGAASMLLEQCARALRFIGFKVLASREIPRTAHPVDQADAAAQRRPQDRNRGLSGRYTNGDPPPGVN